MIYIGIDPGLSGGIAILNHPEGFQGSLRVFKMPPTEADLVGTLRPFAPGWQPMAEEHRGKDDEGTAHWTSGDTVMVWVEKVGAMPTDGRASLAKFMTNYGLIRGILATLGIRREFVRPVDWQRIAGIKRKPKEKRTPWKNRLKQRAQELFPGAKFTLATADAALIAEACRREQHNTGGPEE